MNKIVSKIIMVATVAVLSSCGNTNETYTVQEQTLNEGVYASGELFPEKYHILKSGSAEHILKILVKEGDMVKDGDILVVFGTPSENNLLNILSNQVTIAKENARENSATLAELQHKIALAKQQYEHDKRNADRYRELLKDKAVSQKDAEQAILSAETSLADYNNLQQQYITQKSELSNRVLDAERMLTEARQSQEENILTSRISGRIFNLNFKEGELIEANKPILMVGSPDRYKLELLVDERDISKVAVGQNVFFETDAFAGKQFEAIITKIDPVLQKESRNFKVEASVGDNWNFYPQSSVEANILIRKNEKAILIPSDYLLAGDSLPCQSANGEIKKIKVSTGIRNDNFIEITQGLEVGSIIYKNK